MHQQSPGTRRRVAATAAGLALALLLPRVVAAQSATAGSAQSAEDLKRRLDDFERATRAQIDALRAQIAQQDSELARLRAASTAPAAAPAAPAPAPVTERAVVSATASQETFNRDRESAARVDNVPIDPKLVGFFSIPNTPARMKVDGYAKLDTIFDARPAGNPDQFNVGGIPINLAGPERISNTNIHARQTRMQLDFRSPTGTSSEFRAFAEIDFFGSSGAVDPRMRHFYGQVKNVLLGQTWTTFTDVDAFPDQLDFAGPAGISFLRQAQIRYTYPLATGQSLALGIEKAVVQAPQITSSGTAYTPAPDFVVRYRFERAPGHVQLGSLYRVLGYRIQSANRKNAGYALNASGGLKVFGDDRVLAYVMGGRGAARYVDNISGLNSDLDVNDEGTAVDPLPVFGTYMAYTHRWPQRLRSTAVFGYSSIGNTAAQAATAYKDGHYFSANLLYNAFGSLNVGVEYLYGSHQQHDGGKGTANRVQFAAKYDLYRKRPVDQK
jgi:hypothetical protein